MKPINEAKQAVRRHGAEHVLYCLSLKPADLAAIKQYDPEHYQMIVSVRSAVGRQLSRNMRNASRD